MGRVHEDRIVTMVTANAASLLRLARRHSLCEDDAADAYQRTLELYLGRMHRLDEERVAGWLRTVCKHEAMRIRAARSRVVPQEAVEWDQCPSVDVGDAVDRVESLERVARAAEALGACEPDEARAILLCAGGSSYRQISEQCGWSYSRVNRSLANGRARFLARFAAIESGEACAGFAPVLSAIVDGEASPDDFLAVRPHLRHCAGCRTTLKALYDAEPSLGALLPAGALLVAGPGLVARALESLAAQVGERAVRAHAVVEAATSTKAAAVVASAATVAAGGAAAVEHAARRPAATRPVHALAAAPAPRPRRARIAVAPPTPVPTPTSNATPPSSPAPSPAPSPSPGPSPTPHPEGFDPVAPAAPETGARREDFDGVEAFATAPPKAAASEFGPDG